mmetsp:Transcript_95396/g.294280  ORF Transcript_95396/g.294280 Transcript_95396/m.294280 type:complete len:280 (+) Transcript_95396:196-1035(+)
MPSRDRPTVSRPRLAQGSEGEKPRRSRTGSESAIQKRRRSQSRTPRSTPDARPCISTPISASKTSRSPPWRLAHRPAGRTQGAAAFSTPTCRAATQLQAEKVCPRSTSARIRGPARSLPLQTVPRRRAPSSSRPWPPVSGTSSASSRPKDAPKSGESSGPERHARQTPWRMSKSMSQSCRKSRPSRPSALEPNGPKRGDSSGTTRMRISLAGSPAKCKPRTIAVRLLFRIPMRCARVSEIRLLLIAVSSMNHDGDLLLSNSCHNGTASRSPSLYGPDGM